MVADSTISTDVGTVSVLQLFIMAKIEDHGKV